MSNTDYAYAVARVHSKEMTLFNSQMLEQLLQCKSFEECMRLLIDKGWGDGSAAITADEMLRIEREKTWALISELAEDMSVFDVFLYGNDFHNLKAAIKVVCTGRDSTDGLFIDGGAVESGRILKAVREHDFSLLPEIMRAPAEESYTALQQTGDGQLCDIILDRAALCAILEAGKKSKSELMQKYSELTAAAADIKIAVRSMKTGKSYDFMMKALAPCESLDIDSLARASVKGMDAICEYLKNTAYSSAVDALLLSPSAFERWCDNLIMENIKAQKYNSFTVSPLAAYILARESEIKSVRIILSGKQNSLSDDSVRERLRDMYV